MLLEVCIELPYTVPEVAEALVLLFVLDIFFSVLHFLSFST